jgi:hypothetical protein
MSRVDVQTEINIERPREIVAVYAANPDHAPEWYENIKSAIWQTEKPLRVGSRIAFNASFLGKELSYVYEIKEYEPGRKLVMETAQGPFPMQTTYEWFETGNDTTRMTLRNAGSPSGFSAFFAPFMVWAMKRANRKDLLLLKTILEKQ